MCHSTTLQTDIETPDKQKPRRFHSLAAKVAPRPRSSVEEIQVKSNNKKIEDLFDETSDEEDLHEEDKDKILDELRFDLEKNICLMQCVKRSLEEIYNKIADHDKKFTFYNARKKRKMQDIELVLRRDVKVVKNEGWSVYGIDV